MSYIRSNGRKGLSGAENCMTSQDWDPNCSGSWGTGQCVPRGMAGKAPGCTYAAAPSSSSSGGAWDFLGKLVGGVTDVIKAKATPAPVTNVITPGGAMSTTTKVALAGGAALALVLVLRSRKK